MRNCKIFCRWLPFIIAAVVMLASCTATKKSTTIEFAENPVIAHRGAWKKNSLPENYIAALKRRH